MLRPLHFYGKKTLFPAQLSVDMDLAVVVQKLGPQMPSDGLTGRKKHY